jgi:hypothetical protein
MPVAGSCVGPSAPGPFIRYDYWLTTINPAWNLPLSSVVPTSTGDSVHLSPRRGHAAQS